MSKTMTTNFFSGGTTISGAQLASTITNMASLGGIGRQVLEEFGIREIDPHQDYPFEIRRSIHATVLRRFGPAALYSFGFGYGDSWVHIHDALHALRDEVRSKDLEKNSVLETEKSIELLGGRAFVMMNELLEKNSHGDVYYGAWFNRLGHLHYRAELRNTSAIQQEAFPKGLFLNFFWAVLSDYWTFDVSLDTNTTTYGDEWTHFCWDVYFSPRKSEKSAQELTWEHRLEAREALLGRVLAESEQKNRLISESMNYARRLQEAQLPRPSRFHNRLSECSVLWDPRDTIGGDLWWISTPDKTSRITIVVVDCAGHGVPGAMLALLASTTLERIYASGEHPGPADALQQLGNALRRGLNQDQPVSELTPEHDDGCDAGALQLDLDSGDAIFAGANISLIHLPDGESAHRFKSDSIRLGYRDAADSRPNEINLRYKTGDRFVLTTDGVVDQVGGIANQRPVAFGYKRLMQFLEENRHLSADNLMQSLGILLKQWQGDGIRRDDVTVVCISV
jgi:serine phosphatase RsbU (regulator of sigma subunit)